MFKQSILFIYKRMFPERYARHIGVKIGKGCRLINVSFSTEPYLISLGNKVSATACHFETHDGGVWVLRDRHPDIDLIKPIVVGNNVFIGYGSVLLPGVTVGSNVVIGAYSVVSRDIPSNSVAVGSPAKVIRTLDAYEQKVLLEGKMTKGLDASKKRGFYETTSEHR